ncbi:MAG: hypothetical protein ACOX1T_03415 [Saccharofermentanales bacterium]
MAPAFAPMALFLRANGTMPPRDWLCFAVFRTLGGLSPNKFCQQQEIIIAA